MTPYIESNAKFSPDQKYRYDLWRIWDRDKPMAVFILLNPSKADGKYNDPTVERCERRVRALDKFGGLRVLNIFALVSTNPEKIKIDAHPVGPKNDSTIMSGVQNAGIVVCGWGNKGAWGNRSRQVKDILTGKAPLYCLGSTKRGEPRHPLCLSYSRVLEAYRI